MTAPKSVQVAKTPLKTNKLIDFAATCEFASTSVKLKKISDSILELICDNGSKHQTYELVKNTNDDYWTIGAAYVGAIVNGNNDVSATLLSRSSNKELAISVTANGETLWVPDHGTGTAFAIDEMSIEVDGVPISYATMEINEEITGSKISVQQHCYATFSGVNIAEFWVTFIVGLNGVVNYGWTFKVLQNLRINTAYSLMLPANEAVLTKAVTALKNSQESAGDESTVSFTEEKELIKSAGWLSSVNKNYIAGGTTGNRENTMFVWQRAAEPKIYFRSVNGVDLVLNDVITGSGVIGVAEITNIHDTILN